MADYSILTGFTGPSSDAGDPGSALSLGHVFRITQNCWVTAIRYWRGAVTISGTQKGRIFTVGTQTIVPGTAIDFSAPSGTGWQVATLPDPVQLTPGTDYKVCVHFTDNYSATSQFWSTGGGVGGLVNGPITAPDAGGAPLGLGPTKQGSYGYSTDPDVYPDSYFSGGNYWVDLVVTDQPPDHHSGSDTAPLTLGAHGFGSKSTAAAAEMPLTLTATGDGVKRASGQGTAVLALDASGDGAKHASGAGAATLQLDATGTGTHHGAGAGTAALALDATGQGTRHASGHGTAALTLSASGGPTPPAPDPNGQIDPKLSLKFGGDRPALGTPNGPPPTMWPRELHLLMYPAGAFFRTRTNVVNIGAGLVDSRLLRRNERLLLFLEEAAAVCKRAFDSLYITVPICPSGQTGGGSVDQPDCETPP